MRPVNVYYTEGKYQTRHWSAEKTYKYIFRLEDGLVEAGCFIHFDDLEMTNYTEHVIELSSSIGCAMKCKFCASSQIKKIRTLTPREIFQIFHYIYKDKVQSFSNQTKTVVSFLGIGDLFFTMESVLAAIEMIGEVDERILFNLSSCCWTSDMIKKIRQSGLENKIKTRQITYVTPENKMIRQLIPGLPTLEFEFQNIITEMAIAFAPQKIRINYLMINGVNDSTEDFTMFAGMLKEIADKVVVRISKLNPTIAANMNNLCPSNTQNMQKFLKILKNHDIEAYLFYSYQDDKMNCGQLITE